LRRSNGRAAVLRHTLLVTKMHQARSSHRFWTVTVTITPCHPTRLFQILFWRK
jgi:hypothetical protein